MIVLAVDSTAVCATAAACLFENDRLVTYALTTSKNGLTHSETLLPIADGVLRLLGKQMDEVGLFAVSAGPGSFTGVRIGVSLVKGLAFAGGTPCAAVSPLEALAKAHEAFPGVVCAVMDAPARGSITTRCSKTASVSAPTAPSTPTLCWPSWEADLSSSAATAPRCSASGRGGRICASRPNPPGSRTRFRSRSAATGAGRSDMRSRRTRFRPSTCASRRPSAKERNE